MAVAVAISSIVTDDPSGGLDKTRTRLIVEGTLTLSGNYGGASTHGDTVNFAQFDQIKSGQPPAWVEVQENQGAGNAPLGYNFIYSNGTTQANGVLQITVGTTEVTEATAYSGLSPSLSGVVLRFRAAFPWGV
jgi:hypothetical protein